MKELKVVPRPIQFYDELEELLIKEFKSKIFLPLIRTIHQPASSLHLKNAVETNRDKLIRDIINGVIFYNRGYFKGKFDATTSKEMLRMKAVWSSKEEGWRVPREQIPYPIQNALLNSDTAFVLVVENISKKLNEIKSANFADSIPLEKILSKLVYKTSEDVEATMKGIIIEPKISKELDKQMLDPMVGAASEKIRASIKDWTEENMTKLRGEIQESVLSGNRYGSLVDHIQKTYEVSQSKAKFLARQETNLMVTKIKEDRYKDAGIRKYRWRCVVGSPNHPVRDMHKALDGKEFFFDQPPIVNKNGDRKNPGEDYNCRCTAVPIVRFDDEESYS